MVADLVFHDAYEPGFLGGPACEALTSFESSQERFLHGILRFGHIAQPQQRKLEKIVSVLLNPTFGIRKAAFRRSRRVASCQSPAVDKIFL